MAKKGTLEKTLLFLLSVIIAVALINWGTVAWFNFNIVEWVSFGISWIAKTIYTIAALVGIIEFVRILREIL